MSTNVAYLKRVNAKGIDYLYLVRRKGKRKQYLFSLGHLNQSLPLLYSWREGEELPGVIKKFGFDYQDIQEWILTLETGYTKSAKRVQWIFDWKEKMERLEREDYYASEGNIQKVFEKRRINL